MRFALDHLCEEGFLVTEVTIDRHARHSGRFCYALNGHPTKAQRKEHVARCIKYRGPLDKILRTPAAGDPGTTDAAAAYQQHLDRIFSDLAPATDAESSLVQHIADTEWRLLRIAPMEASLYAVGRRELADTVSDEPDPANREALLMGNIFITYRRDLNNLALQERRLRNQRQADLAELRALQKERFDRERKSLRSARRKSAAPKRSATMPAPTTLNAISPSLASIFQKKNTSPMPTAIGTIFVSPTLIWTSTSS